MRQCIICGCGDLKVEETFPSYEVVVCQKCKYGMVSPVPSGKMLDDLYNSKEYFSTHMQYDFDSITEEKIRQLVEGRKALHVQNLGNIIRQCKTLLEIGSGGGFSLKAFEGLSLRAKGIETSKPAAEFARSRLRVDVENTSMEEFSTKETYDLVFLNHVLEHFLDPIDAFKKLAPLVAPGGYLYIRVPDHDSYDRLAYGKSWPAYAHYHISYFSEKSLQRLYDSAGFTDVYTQFFLSEKANILIRKIAKGPFRKGLTKRFNGRTITIVGRKPAQPTRMN